MEDTVGFVPMAFKDFITWFTVKAPCTHCNSIDLLGWVSFFLNVPNLVVVRYCWAMPCFPALSTERRGGKAKVDEGAE